MAESMPIAADISTMKFSVAIMCDGSAVPLGRLSQDELYTCHWAGGEGEYRLARGQTDFPRPSDLLAVRSMEALGFISQYRFAFDQPRNAKCC